MQTFVNTIRKALDSVNPQVPFVDSSPSNQIQATDPYTKRYSPHSESPFTILSESRPPCLGSMSMGMGCLLIFILCQAAMRVRQTHTT